MEINLRGQVNQIYDQITMAVKSRCFLAAQELRDASLDVLSGKRSGRTYRKPFTKTALYYRASAPGEPPTERSGTLNKSWYPRAQSETAGGSVTVMPAIWTDVMYAPILQSGSAKMAPRPFEDPIIERAAPKIEAIFRELIP